MEIVLVGRRVGGRFLLLFAWCLVLWGTIVFLSLVYDVVREGLPALRHFDPRVQRSPEAWVNLGCAVAAPAVWLLLIAAIALGRRRPAPPPASSRPLSP